MHMADALLSPAVGAVMWAASALVMRHCARHVQQDADERRVPLMGVLGAFLFAAQMVNFSIPGTGSSGHLGGGLLLAILLGPHAAFLVMASVLIVQALFFADGGLLALGCNLFNLGVFPAFVAYPVYRWLAGDGAGKARSALAAVVAAVLGLQLGALAVVLQTVASGISALPLAGFAAFMLPIHLGIGVVEGLVTAAIVGFVRGARPDILPGRSSSRRPLAGVLAAGLAAAALTGGIGAWYASQHPDGLEWAVARTSGNEHLSEGDSAWHSALARLQQRLALLPDYGFPVATAAAATPEPPATEAGHAPGSVAPDEERLGTSVAGLLGGAITLLLALVVGFVLQRRARQ